MLPNPVCHSRTSTLAQTVSIKNPTQPDTQKNTPLTLPLPTTGIALSADGERIYWKSVANRYLFSIPTERLRDRSATSEVLAQSAINNHGQSGVSDGMETDTNGFIYHGNMEQNAVSIFNPANGTVNTFVRDPRLNWVDTVSLMLSVCVCIEGFC
jgi:sugar lactone lactonase YvrE